MGLDACLKVVEEAYPNASIKVEFVEAAAQAARPQPSWRERLPARQTEMRRSRTQAAQSRHIPVSGWTALSNCPIPDGRWLILLTVPIIREIHEIAEVG